MKVRQFLAVLVLALGACHGPGGNASPAASEAPAVHPESGLPVIALTVTHAGQAQAFRVELAQTAEQQARGLMFRTALGPDEGMLFPIDPPRPASFWMKNTVIPLDILFIGPDRRILNIAARARPYDETPLASAGPAAAVLELAGGRAAQLGIAPGDRVEW